MTSKKWVGRLLGSALLLILNLGWGHVSNTTSVVHALPGETTCVSVDPGGIPGNDYSTRPDITPDGRYVVFESSATNLVSGDPNGGIFVRDLQAGQTTRIPVDGEDPVISGDGRYIAFTSFVIGEKADTTTADIFVYDRQTGTSTKVSAVPGGGQGDGWSEGSDISDDGRFVIFQSDASNLVANDVNGVSDIFVRDMLTGTTELVSVASNGT